MKQMLLLPVLLSSLPLRAWQQPLTLDRALQQVQENVAQFEAALPDFVCDERIASVKLSAGKAGVATLNESTFVSRQNRDQKGHLTWMETREAIAIDGKKVSKGRKLKGPFIMTGGFSALLTVVFDAHMAQYRNFTLLPAEPGQAKAMVAVGFTTKEGQKEIGAFSNGTSFLQKDSGKALIDRESMQIVHLENQILNSPGRYPVWTTSVDYADVTIDGKTFRMPKTVRADVRRSAADPPARQFSAEYSNYRKFNVSSGVVY